VAERVLFAVNVCILVQRDGRWLLDTRTSDADHASALVGLIGGHVEVTDGPDHVFESAARREFAEETGIDLSDVPLQYLDSELYEDRDRRPVLTVTYVAQLPAGREPELAKALEPGQPAWWSLEELEADPRCAPWTPRLVRQAQAALNPA
jgi:8-oxo-dGTP pyrophosphatase MutT (NUDIX family)